MFRRLFATIAKRIWSRNATVFALAVGWLLARPRRTLAITHVHMNKQQYIDNVLDPNTSLESEYFLIVCDRGLPRQELDRLVESVKKTTLKMGLQATIMSVEARDIEQLDSIVQRVKKAKERSKTQPPAQKRQRRNPPSADLYFKSKSFQRPIQLDGFAAETVEARVSAIRNLIKDHANQALLEKTVKLAERQFDAPVIVRHVSNQQKYNEFKEQLHTLLTQGLIPIGTQVLIARQPLRLSIKETLAADGTVIYRNSLAEWMESKFGGRGQSTPESLESFQAAHKNLSRTESLSCFVLPKIFTVRASNFQQELVKLFKAFHLDRERPTVSLRISSKETNEDRLRLFYELYKKYHNQAHFIVVTGSHVEELFGHTHEACEDFVMFNFFKPLDTNQSNENGFIRPYRKSFLGSYQEHLTYADNLHFMTHEIQLVLRGKNQMKDYNVLKLERQQEINLKKLQELMTRQRPFLLRFCNKQCSVRQELLETDLNLYWLDTNVHNVENIGDVLVDPQNHVLQPV